MADWTYSSSAPWYVCRSSVKSVKIESGVTSIGADAFGYCTSLKKATIYSKTAAFDGYIF
ncbi:MAG: leucine-rich repeat protein [Clostridia bacterium]|nr:leucine-rich repeat protein [Clostridia bacterium]